MTDPRGLKVNAEFRLLQSGCEISDSEPAFARSILVVEDNPADAYLIRRFLESSGSDATIEVISTFEDGLCALETGRFDVALVDHRLGPRTGLRMIEVARERGIQIPLIVLTGDNSVEGAALERGASDFIDKNTMTSRCLERAIRFNLHRARGAQEQTRLATRYEAVVRGSGDGAWDWDLTTGSIDLSARFRELAEMPDSEATTSFSRWLEFVHVEDRAGVRAAVREHLSGKSPTLSREYRAVLADGGHRWILLRGLAKRGRGERFERLAGTQTDITARKRRETEIRRVALLDPVSGLANRKVLEERMHAGIHRAVRDGGHAFSIVLLSVDSFFEVKEQEGRRAAEELLRRVGSRLRGDTRSFDCVARLDGGEFVVILDDCGSEDRARETAAELSETVGQSLRLESGTVKLRLRVGIAVVRDDLNDPADILEAADGDMSGRKVGGRGAMAIAGRETPSDELVADVG